MINKDTAIPAWYRVIIVEYSRVYRHPDNHTQADVCVRTQGSGHIRYWRVKIIFTCMGHHNTETYGITDRSDAVLLHVHKSLTERGFVVA